MKFFSRSLLVLLFFSLLLTLSNCEKEEIALESVTQKKYETVKINEAKQFLVAKQQEHFLKNSNVLNISYDVEDLTYEELINSDASLAIIPAETKYSKHYNRVILLRIDGEVTGALFAMYASNEKNTQYFSGEIMITDLDGNFLDGYRADNGILVTQLLSPQPKNKTAIRTKSDAECPDHGQCITGTECIICEQLLEEVVIPIPSGPEPEEIDLGDSMSGGGDLSGGEGNPPSWDYNAGGNASTNEGAETCAEGQIKDENGNCTATCSEGYVLDENNTCVEETVDSVPPSCKSFNFEEVASNWQAATVKGIKFGIGTYTTGGNITKYRIEYGDSTVTFESWLTDRFGNSVSEGAAAEIAAYALTVAIRNTAHHFKDKYGFSETQIRLYFEDQLKDEYATFSDGGRITFRTNPYNQTATNYKTSLWLIDECD